MNSQHRDQARRQGRKSPFLITIPQVLEAGPDEARLRTSHELPFAQSGPVSHAPEAAEVLRYVAHPAACEPGFDRESEPGIHPMLQPAIVAEELKS